MDWSKKGRIAALVAAALVGTFLVPLQAARADDGPLMGGIGGDYSPISNTHIRMQSETVQAVVYRQFAEYQVDFLFVNSGPAQRVTLGFPFAVDPRDDSAHPVAFRAWRDGEPLGVTVGGGAKDLYTKYYVHVATFPRGKTMIRVSYLARESLMYYEERFPELMPPQFAAQPDIYGAEASYDYWLHTGAGWAGTIGTAVVRYTLADDFRGYALDVSSSTPAEDEYWNALTKPASYFRPDYRTFEWVFRNLEPTEKDDVELGFTQLSFSGIAAETPALMGAMAAGAIPTPADPDDASGWSMVDGDPATGLALKGAHPSVFITVVGDKQLKEMRIVAGDNSDTESFRQSGRPKDVKVTLSDGTTSTIRLADEPSLQTFPISGRADWVQLDVIDCYPGSKNADICIAEVGFGNQPAPAFQAFETLIKASASVVTTSTDPVPTSSTSSTEDSGTTETGYTEEAASPLVVVSTTTTARPTSTTTTVTAAPPAAEEQRATAWTAWPIVLLAVAGAALLTAAALTGILLTRRKAGR